MQSIEKKIAELNARKQELQKAKDFIEEKKKEYEEAIRKPAAFAEREERKIRDLLASKVSVSLQSYVEELAKLWNLDINKLKANLIFETFNGKMTKEELLNMYYTEFSFSGKTHNALFLVNYKDGEITRSAYIDYPITINFFSSKQRNNLPLIDCLKAIVKFEDGSFESTFVCDDYKNIQFAYPFSKMVNIMNDGHYSSTANIALLNAAIRDNQSCKEEKLL